MIDSSRRNNSESPPRPVNITFIGGGNMASAIIGGLLKKDYPAAALRVVDTDLAACSRIEQHYVGVKCFNDARKAILSDDVVVLAVKPQQLRDVAQNLPLSANGNLVISIAAGIKLADVSRWLRSHTKLIRAMPNTPALIGRGITALYPYGYPQHVTENELQTAERILGAVGQTVRILDEWRGDQLLDAVTAVSGSGPAYVFFFMQAVEEAARELDLPAEIAHKLVLETFIGAAHLAAQSSEPLAVLREHVTSRHWRVRANASKLPRVSSARSMIAMEIVAAAAGKRVSRHAIIRFLKLSRKSNRLKDLARSPRTGLAESLSW